MHIGNPAAHHRGCREVAVPDLDPGGTDDPVELFARCSAALLEAVAEAVEPWIVECVASRLPVDLDDDARAGALAEAARVGAGARAETVAALGDLLALDVDAQTTNPMAVIRQAVVHVTAVLAAAGAVPVRRDPFAERAFPADIYDLSPANFDAVSPDLHDVGLMWGAAKAHLVLSRHNH